MCRQHEHGAEPEVGCRLAFVKLALPLLGARVAVTLPCSCPLDCEFGLAPNLYGISSLLMSREG